ncbi:MAG TPA: hypothetical protein VKB46_11780 [Pyrinomonadaceae bacterium]|nr:hypothetical protein [Pyrinomonadaceae bacterium]
MVPANFTQPLVGKPTYAQVVGWVCIAFSLFCAVMSWRAGQGNVSPYFLLFGLLGVYLVASVGTVEITPDYITYKTPLATYAIRWDEVERIEIDAQGGALVFAGANKRVVTIGPSYWSGKDKPELMALIYATVDKRKILVIPTQSALIKLSKNTKVASLFGVR